MDRNLFVKLVFGTHKVADLLKNPGRIKEAANLVLADLMLFCDESLVTLEQKKNVLPRTLRNIDALLALLALVKGEINPKHFFILEREYKKISKELVEFLERNKRKETSLSTRQTKILELLKNKEKTQVWELQKVLPEVTKRTLRRDLDHLLSLNLIERKGEWNNVFYQYKV